jgi:predicted Zn-dependent protease with MMP-like domain
MRHEDFINVAEETLDSLPEEFRSCIKNVAILAKDFPASGVIVHRESTGLFRFCLGVQFAGWSLAEAYYDNIENDPPLGSGRNDL